MLIRGKRQRPIERKWVDLERPIDAAGRIIHLSNHHGRHWSGIVDLAPHGSVVLGSHFRNDLLILEGELWEQENSPHTRGSFLSYNKTAELRIGSLGARVFWYRDSEPAHHCPPLVVAPERQWSPGAVSGIFISEITHFQHALYFVRWTPGAQLSFHEHQKGEDIFVISGKLRDQNGEYPAGSWLRFHPGSGHAPEAEIETFTLLRGGHLGGY